MDVIVETESGKIRGVTSDSFYSYSFKGVRLQEMNGEE